MDLGVHTEPEPWELPGNLGPSTLVNIYPPLNQWFLNSTRGDMSRRIRYYRVAIRQPPTMHKPGQRSTMETCA